MQSPADQSIGILLCKELALELFLNRSFYVDEAEGLLLLIQLENLQAYITSECLESIYFYLSKPNPKLGVEAVSALVKLLHGYEYVIDIDTDLITAARSSIVKDFEAALSIACAARQGVEAIVTRHPERFGGSDVPVYMADSFLKRMDLEMAMHKSQVSFCLDEFPDSGEVDLMREVKEKNKRLDLSGKDLRDISIGSLNLRGASLQNTNLQGVNLSLVSLSFAQLWGADLSGAKLPGANLSLANLNEAVLSNADLSGANLSKANFSNADLNGASLQGADLQGADLHGADLRGANFYKANLNGADLRDAIVEGAKFGKNFGLSVNTRSVLRKGKALLLENDLAGLPISISSRRMPC